MIRRRYHILHCVHTSVVAMDEALVANVVNVLTITAAAAETVVNSANDIMWQYDAVLLMIVNMNYRIHARATRSTLSTLRYICN